MSSRTKMFCQWNVDFSLQHVTCTRTPARTHTHTQSLWRIAAVYGWLCSLMLLTAPNGAGRPCVIRRLCACHDACLSEASSPLDFLPYPTTNPIDPTTHTHAHTYAISPLPIFLLAAPWMAAVCSPWRIAPGGGTCAVYPCVPVPGEVIIEMSSERRRGGSHVFVGGCVEERLCSEVEGPNFDQN